eukprot:gb/GFBE01037643.1/.p1 GENE.gb/GFBE01037643.1/~~gb/GFBE01037643.1/.p1  ORF type:complete len:958 (+),score=196.24 gb/GFBE01037643.1/:1-2874(+)
MPQTVQPDSPKSPKITVSPNVRASEGKGRADPRRSTLASLESGERRSSQVKAAQSRWYELLCAKIVENSVFVGATTLLTLYALTADDVRVLLTQKPLDIYFDVMVLVCLVIFSFEIIVSVYGKADYWLGFFFTLDLISTASLILDLTWVSNAMSGGNSSSLRSGRTARIGAKAARMIRVLRLVRILKLYKAVYDARQERLRRQREAAEGKSPGDDDWDDDDPELEQATSKVKEQQPDQESTLGKKLSEMTTRRVIILILAMLLTLPLLATDEVTQVPFSAEYGANVVLDTFKDFEKTRGSEDQLMYQNAVLRYAFFHNWYAGQGAENDFCPYSIQEACSNAFLGHLYFIGIRGKDLDTVDSKAALAKLNRSVILDFNARSAAQDLAYYNYGIMPLRAQELLSSDWTVACGGEGSTLRGVSIISESMDGAVDFPIGCPEDLRVTESSVFSPILLSGADFDDWHFEFYFDIRPYNEQMALYSLLTTGFVMVLLLTGSLMFSSDANTLVINPVEQMIRRVKAIRDNPLIAMKMADEEFRAEEIKRSKQKRQTAGYANGAKALFMDILSCRCFSKANPEGPMETVILEKTIIKLGSLLALGFGEAGANIISHNMKGSDTAGVNAMVPGTHVDCIIGVCKVLDFSTATEVLQARIMTFVNQIAEIIHGVVDEFHGAPNKNSGENFLIIWRMDSADEQVKERKMAEMSIVAFAKILGALHRSALLADYRTHPGLQYRLGKGSRVNLSFGVHAGWAIEGAVGSEFKIDASYVSPNVSIAASVERCTQVYGVSLVVAQSAMELCTQEFVSKCRLIDRVLITGSATPMELYCVDLDWTSVAVDDSPPPEVVWNTKNRYRARQFIESQKNSKWHQDFTMAKAFDEDPTIAVMRRRYTTQFFQLFNMGYQNYFQGEWQVARRMLSETRHILGAEDGPSTALLKYMEDPHQFEAPKDWQQVRDMSSMLA